MMPVLRSKPLDGDENDQYKKDLLSSDPTAGTAPASPSGTAWRPPRPIGDVPELDEMDPRMLPAGLRRFVTALSEATQTPVDLAALLTLSVASVALLKKVRVQVRPDWKEHVGIYAMVAMPPSSTKSPVFRPILAPVRAWEAAEQARLEPAIKANNAKRVRLDRNIKHQERKLFNTSESGKRLELTTGIERLQAELDALPDLVPPRILIDDTTPEAMVHVLARHHERLGMFSDEGGVIATMGGRYSGKSQANTDLFKKTWDGSSHRVDRVKDGTHIALDEPLLAVGLAVQPLILDEMTARADFRQTGVVARFLYARPRARVGSRNLHPTPMPTEITDQYSRAMEALLALPLPGSDEATIERSRLIKLSPEAQQVFDDFRAWLEPELAEHGELSHLAGWAGKLPSQLVRLAALFQVLEAAFAGERLLNKRTRVSEDPMKRAMFMIRLHLIPHAEACIAGLDPHERAAKVLLGWMARKGMTRFKLTEAKRVLKRGARVKSDEGIKAIMELLEDHDYIAGAEGKPSGGRGRPPSPTYLVNPEWDRGGAV